MSAIRFGKVSGDFERVEMIIMPMIDVCFLLMTFFIANMRLYEPEGDFNITMPPAAPLNGAGGLSKDNDVLTIKIRLLADKNGRLAGIRMGERPLASLKNLREHVKQICSDDNPSAAVPEIEFECASTLQYDCVMDAITAVSGYVAADGRTIVPIVKNVKFSTPKK
jgi:biopolymer transport protein ExbD